MRFMSFTVDGRATYGRVMGGRVSDVGAEPDVPPDLRAALAAGALEVIAARASQEHELAAISPLPVIPRPSKILCVGHNYETHRLETGRAKAQHPSIFTRFADTLVGNGASLLRPRISTMFDYEGELAVVIGEGGRNIAESDAMRYVAGFSCFNDASVRDWQWHTSQFTPGKNFPNTAALGPWLVTPQEIGDLGAMTLTTRLNGAVVQQARLEEMIFPVSKIIAYVSVFTELSPGDVIATGTPGGVGAKREPPRWMAPGDVVEVEISEVGLLRNGICDA